MADATASPGLAVELPPAAPGADESGVGGTWRDRLRAAWNAFVAAIGIVMGLVPHVLHHVSFLAGTALVAGSGGTALFGALGLLASVPMLLRLRRRFGTWRAPAVGLLVFAIMFSLSAFVVGPAISGAGDDPPTAPKAPRDSHHSAANSPGAGGRSTTTGRDLWV